MREETEKNRVGGGGAAQVSSVPIPTALRKKTIPLPSMAWFPLPLQPKQSSPLFLLYSVNVYPLLSNPLNLNHINHPSWNRANFYFVFRDCYQQDDANLQPSNSSKRKVKTSNSSRIQGMSLELLKNKIKNPLVSNNSFKKWSSHQKNWLAGLFFEISRVWAQLRNL